MKITIGLAGIFLIAPALVGAQSVASVPMQKSVAAKRRAIGRVTMPSVRAAVVKYVNANMTAGSLSTSDNFLDFLDGLNIYIASLAGNYNQALIGVMSDEDPTAPPVPIAPVVMPVAPPQLPLPIVSLPPVTLVPVQPTPTFSFPHTFAATGRTVYTRQDAEGYCGAMAPGSGGPGTSLYARAQAECVDAGFAWGGGMTGMMGCGQYDNSESSCRASANCEWRLPGGMANNRYYCMSKETGYPGGGSMMCGSNQNWRSYSWKNGQQSCILKKYDTDEAYRSFIDGQNNLVQGSCEWRDGGNDSKPDTFGVCFPSSGTGPSGMSGSAACQPGQNWVPEPSNPQGGYCASSGTSSSGGSGSYQASVGVPTTQNGERGCTMNGSFSPYPAETSNMTWNQMDLGCEGKSTTAAVPRPSLLSSAFEALRAWFNRP